jgi:rhodanese-related sulfurtransferase
MTDIDPSALSRAIVAAAAPLILDVRSRAEYAAGHVPGAVNIPFWALPWRAGELRVPTESAIVVYCGHGPRAQLACLVLRRRGFVNVACLAGHMAEWRRAGYPEERTVEP